MRRERRAANLRRLRHVPAHVEIQVDEFLLHGFPAGERYTIGDAFSRELERVIAGVDFRSGFRRDTILPDLDAGRVSPPAHAGPTALGAQVAQAVYRGLDAHTGEGK